MEQEFFDQAAQRWQDMVFRLALHQLGSYADADDAVQEVFLRLWRQKVPFASDEHLRRWLMRVTVNWCRDQLRSPWRKRRVDWDSLENQPAFETPEQGELYEAVMSLPEKYRTVLDLFYYEELLRPGDRGGAGAQPERRHHPPQPGEEAPAGTLGGMAG